MPLEQAQLPPDTDGTGAAAGIGLLQDMLGGSNAIVGGYVDDEDNALWVEREENTDEATADDGEEEDEDEGEDTMLSTVSHSSAVSAGTGGTGGTGGEGFFAAASEEKQQDGGRGRVSPTVPRLRLGAGGGGAGGEDVQDIMVEVSVVEHASPYELRFEVTEPTAAVAHHCTVTVATLERLLLPAFNGPEGGDGGLSAQLDAPDVRRAMRAWVETGQVPQRKYVVRWLLDRMWMRERAGRGVELVLGYAHAGGRPGRAGGVA